MYFSTMTTTRSGSPSDFMTTEAKVAQPHVAQESQGIMTRSKTSTLGSATLLSPSPPPAPNPDGDAFQVEAPWPSQAQMDVAIPPKPGEMSSLATKKSPPAGGVNDDHLSNLSESYICHRPSGPKPEIQHDRRGRGMPTLTREEVTIREGKRSCCS